MGFTSAIYECLVKLIPKADFHLFKDSVVAYINKYVELDTYDVKYNISAGMIDSCNVNSYMEKYDYLCPKKERIFNNYHYDIHDGSIKELSCLPLIENSSGGQYEDYQYNSLYGGQSDDVVFIYKMRGVMFEGSMAGGVKYNSFDEMYYYNFELDLECIQSNVTSSDRSIKDYKTFHLGASSNLLYIDPRDVDLDLIIKELSNEEENEDIEDLGHYKYIRSILGQ